MIKQVNTVDGKYGVELIENDGKILAIAIMNDSDGYGTTSYWFTVGTYKNEKTAIAWSRKKLAKLGKELA